MSGPEAVPAVQPRTVRTMVFDLESPITDLEGGVQALYRILETTEGEEEAAALYFVTDGVSQRVRELKALYEEMFRAVSDKKQERLAR